MKKYKVFLSTPANYDLIDIFDYIAVELSEPITADRLIDKLETAITRLGDMPFRHPVVSEKPYSRYGMRRLYVENYTVFYIINNSAKTVNIVRILYSRRDWEKLIER